MIRYFKKMYREDPALFALWVIGFYGFAITFLLAS